jgi:transposase-like protein
LSEQRKYRTFTAQQKLEIVLAGLRGDVTVKELCRSHEIAETLYYSWREKLLEGGREALAGKHERQGERELKRRIGQLERALGRKTYELEIAGEALRGWEGGHARPVPASWSPRVGGQRWWRACSRSTARGCTERRSGGRRLLGGRCSIRSIG